jgi:hypothetical protein
MSEAQGSGKRQRAPSFKLEVPGDAAVKQRIMEKISQVRAQLSKSAKGTVNHADILETVLDSWLGQLPDGTENETASAPRYAPDTIESGGLYLTTKSSLEKLINLVHNHSRTCKMGICTTDVKRRGHAALMKFTCSRSKHFCHKFWWASSPMLPNHRYYVNERVMHGLLFSGMRPSHYTRLVKGANMGIIKKGVRSKFLDANLPFLEEEYNDSIETALHEEMGYYDIQEGANEWQGIDVCTDARHGHRKNAKDTSMIAIGDQSKKVLGHFHVTKARDSCTQRHEKIGVEEFYRYIDSKDVPIRIHIHDRNLSVNSFIKKLNGPINQNDRWHGIKNLKKDLEKISDGAKKNEGKTWHGQVQGKVEAIGTHAHWAIENCNGDPDTLRASLENVIAHYQNNHAGCHPTSRCRTAGNYEPSKEHISSPIAERLLRKTITESTLYKAADDFVHGKSTSHVESFNNTMNMFHDKRIFYGDKEYKARSYIAVLYWNENSGREHTSVWQRPKQSGSTRRARKIKVYKKATFNYQKNVWRKYYCSL